MTNPLHDAAMAAKRFHDAALAYLDATERRPARRFAVRVEQEELEYALKRLKAPDMNTIVGLPPIRK